MLLINELNELSDQSRNNINRRFMIYLILKEIDPNTIIEEHDWLFLRNQILMLTRTDTLYNALGKNGRKSFVKQVLDWTNKRGLR